MIKRLICLYLILVCSVFANGGGYHHGVDFTGGVSPFTAEGTEHIQILDEQLDIYLGLEQAKVSVAYQMKKYF